MKMRKKIWENQLAESKISYMNDGITPKMSSYVQSDSLSYFVLSQNCEYFQEYFGARLLSILSLRRSICQEHLTYISSHV